LIYAEYAEYTQITGLKNIDLLSSWSTEYRPLLPLFSTILKYGLGAYTHTICKAVFEAL
jgi:hypothetical protein